MPSQTQALGAETKRALSENERYAGKLLYLSAGLSRGFLLSRQWVGSVIFDQRRISVSVELSEPGDYDGGVLEIAPAVGVPRTLPRGGARLFRSRMIHRVTPVTRGVRDALVAWTGRKP